MFSDRFDELCKMKGVKPGRACIEMGLSRTLAAKWKASGTKKPSADALEKMSKYFGKSIEEILGTVRENKSAAKSQIGFDDFTYAMYNEGQSLTEGDKSLLLQMARQLSEKNKKSGKAN